MFPSDNGCDLNTIRGKMLSFLEGGARRMLMQLNVHASYLPLLSTPPLLPHSTTCNAYGLGLWTVSIRSTVLSIISSLSSFSTSLPLVQTVTSTSPPAALLWTPETPGSLPACSQVNLLHKLLHCSFPNPSQGFLLFITFQVPKPSRCGLNCLVRLLLD